MKALGTMHESPQKINDKRAVLFDLLYPQITTLAEVCASVFLTDLPAGLSDSDLKIER